MKHYIALLLFVVIGIASSCSSKCSDVDAPEAPSIFVKLIDATSEEDVFENGTFTENHIVITDSEENDVPFGFVNESNILHIVPEYQNITSNTIVITLNNPDTMEERSIEITYTVQKNEQECYTLHSIVNVSIPNNESNFANSIYTIKI